MKTVKLFSSILILIATFSLVSLNTEAQTSTNNAKYESFDLKVGMTCNACKVNVEKCLAYEKGVKNFDIDLETKKVSIKYNPKKTDKETIKKSVAKLGYTVSDFKTSGCKSKSPDCLREKTKCCSKKKS